MKSLRKRTNDIFDRLDKALCHSTSYIRMGTHYVLGVQMIVKLTGEFATNTGRSEVEIYGPTTIKGLLSALNNSYPGTGWDNSNVAINGTMYSNAWLQKITEADEIVIMPPIEGG